MKYSLREVQGGRETLAAIAEKVRKRKPLNAALGKRMEAGLRGHFAARDAAPNKQGWPKQHFWGGIRKATAYAGADETSSRVVISDPAFNQKFYGGTITPGPGKKYLALPAIAEAYGHSPKEFDFLQFQPGRRGGSMVEKQRTITTYGRKKKDGTRTAKETESWGGRVWYWLVKSVTQDADPNALPSGEVIRAALLDEAKQYLSRLA